VNLFAAKAKGIQIIKHYDAEKSDIDHVVKRFFSTFNNVNGISVNLASLTDIFMAGAVIVKTCGETPFVADLPDFIAPRQKLLNDGDLECFSEEELWERTDIFGGIAQRICMYRKSGVLYGQGFETKGMKSIQLVKTETGWKILSVAWDDERDGLSAPVFPDLTEQSLPDEESI